MITWGDVVEIIIGTFNINQTQLAELMNCNKGAITKIKQGIQPLSLDADQLFSRVFDPATSNGPASKGGREPQYWLDLVKKEIESNFKEVRAEMDNCWDEKDYRTFVMALLERAKKGASSKKEPQPSECSRESATASDIVIDEDHDKRQEKVSLNETPAECMSRIFEQSVADYNIATAICRVSDYLCGEPFYANNVFAFIDAIQTNVLEKFISYQNEEVYDKISQFQNAINTYSGFLGMIQPSVAEKYGHLLKICGLDNGIIDLINSDYNEIKNHLDTKTYLGEANELSVYGSEKKLTQLDFIRSILSSHKQLCELYSEICPGKTILVF